MGNPHSTGSGPGQRSEAIITSARRRVLQWFGAPSGEFVVIFTSGATGAIKLVADAFDWKCGCEFRYLNECHTSILGVREVAARAGANIRAVSYEDASGLIQNAHTACGECPSLLAYPPECNFSGRKYSLELAREYSALKSKIGRSWYVLVDAAKHASTSPLDLSTAGADFVCISFYKLFGMPTGLGALIARKTACEAVLTRRAYFGGGTVDGATASERYHVARKDLTARFEDGTASFLAIAQLECGFDTLTRLAGGMLTIANHTHACAAVTARRLDQLRHYNGAPVVKIYGGWLSGAHPMGSIVAFNCLRPDGTPVGFAEVEEVAAIEKVYLRAGCFCNPGACETYLGLTAEQVKAHLARGKICGDAKDVIDGQPTGALRASFGYMSTMSDVQALVGVIEKYVVRAKPDVAPDRESGSQHSVATITELVVFPVKSCGGMKVRQWGLGAAGLEYDRMWQFVDNRGEVLNQKGVAKLATIQASILLPQTSRDTHQLQLSAPGHPTFTADTHAEMMLVDASCWASAVLGCDVTMVRAQTVDSSEKASFANTGPSMLLLTESSIRELARRTPPSTDPSSFNLRGNIMVRYDAPPHSEDRWESVVLKSSCMPQQSDMELTIKSKCTRCRMVNINPTTGLNSPVAEPLRTMAQYRRIDGVLCFGVLLSTPNFTTCSSHAVIAIGDTLHAKFK